jgi:hypothetical protein
MPDGGCCTCEAMMCDGEDRVVGVKKREEVRVGERRCYKGQCVSEKCTNGDPIRSAKSRGERLVQGFFRGRVSRRSREGGSVGSYAPLSCSWLKALPLPSLLRCPMLPMAGARIG